MKRFLQRSSVLLLFSCLSSTLFAQFPIIQSLYVIPANPTTHDTVKVVAQTVFPSGSCELALSSFGILSGTIEVYAQHNLGMLTYICNSTDTLTLGKLENGTYKLRYHLSCLPCGSSTDLDSVSFTVQAYTGLDMKGNVQFFTLFPNPAQSSVSIKIPDAAVKSEILVFDLQGREQLRHQAKEEQTEIDISGLAKGVYFIKVSSGAATSGFKKIIKL